MSIDRFEFSGVNHLAMVCKDMAATMEFYEGVLGMPLVCALDLPDGGQHFFFDAGNETLIAFFWFGDAAPEPEPGRVAPAAAPGQGDFTSAIGSMNHVALTVPLDTFEDHVQLLHERGVDCSEIMNHDDSKWQVSRRFHEGVWLRSVYFFDPNGILLELSALARPFTEADAVHDPKDAAGDRVSQEDVRAWRRPGAHSIPARPGADATV